eukprot:g2582.t1
MLYGASVEMVDGVATFAQIGVDVGVNQSFGLSVVCVRYGAGDAEQIAALTYEAHTVKLRAVWENFPSYVRSGVILAPAPRVRIEMIDGSTWKTFKDRSEKGRKHPSVACQFSDPIETGGLHKLSGNIDSFAVDGVVTFTPLAIIGSLGADIKLKVNCRIVGNADDAAKFGQMNALYHSVSFGDVSFVVRRFGNVSYPSSIDARTGSCLTYMTPAPLLEIIDLGTSANMRMIDDNGTTCKVDAYLCDGTGKMEKASNDFGSRCAGEALSMAGNHAKARGGLVAFDALAFAKSPEPAQCSTDNSVYCQSTDIQSRQVDLVFNCFWNGAGHNSGDGEVVRPVTKALHVEELNASWLYPFPDLIQSTVDLEYATVSGNATVSVPLMSVKVKNKRAGSYDESTDPPVKCKLAIDRAEVGKVLINDGTVTAEGRASLSEVPRLTGISSAAVDPKTGLVIFDPVAVKAKLGTKLRFKVRCEGTVPLKPLESREVDVGNVAVRPLDGGSGMPDTVFPSTNTRFNYIGEEAPCGLAAANYYQANGLGEPPACPYPQLEIIDTVKQERNKKDSKTKCMVTPRGFHANSSHPDNSIVLTMASGREHTFSNGLVSLKGMAVQVSNAATFPEYGEWPDEIKLDVECYVGGEIGNLLVQLRTIEMTAKLAKLEARVTSGPRLLSHGVTAQERKALEEAESKYWDRHNTLQIAMQRYDKDYHAQLGTPMVATERFSQVDLAESNEQTTYKVGIFRQNCNSSNSNSSSDCSVNTFKDTICEVKVLENSICDQYIEAKGTTSKFVPTFQSSVSFDDIYFDAKDLYKPSPERPDPPSFLQSCGVGGSATIKIECKGAVVLPIVMNVSLKNLRIDVCKMGQKTVGGYSCQGCTQQEVSYDGLNCLKCPSNSRPHPTFSHCECNPNYVSEL